jgi:FKBP-type peptidyl-prolyl cis-trans isomerase
MSFRALAPAARADKAALSAQYRPCSAAAGRHRLPAALRATAGGDRAAAPIASPPPSASRRALLLLSAAAAALAPPRPARADEAAAPDEAAPAPAPPADPSPLPEPYSSSSSSARQQPMQQVSAAAQSDDGTGDVALLTTESASRELTPTDRQVLALNRRVQAQNRAPPEFPAFVRRGFDILIVADGFEADGQGLVFRDYVAGDATKPLPRDGQEVVFDYVGYNESGAVIDSSYRQGRPAQTRLGVKGLIPGFELGLRGMRPGGKRRVVVPPALGPPVGPQTFFSAKQCEVFDVEMREVRDCERKTVGMFSNVVCTPIV